MENNIPPIKPPQISLDELPLYKCECGGEFFQAYIQLKEVSPILSGTGKTEVIPVQAIACVKCFKKYESPKIVLTP